MPNTKSKVPFGSGWVCFYCGERFTDYQRAKDHFGQEILFNAAACQIKAGYEYNLVLRIRTMEVQLARYRNEDSDTDRLMHKMQTDHDQALIRAEENGYAKGLKDAQSEKLSEGTSQPWSHF
jgi:hypothetical protein